MTPICTRVNAESLPGLLERLEGETSIKWIGGNSPCEVVDACINHGVAYLFSSRFPFESSHTLKASTIDEDVTDETLVTPNRFTELVAEACPKEE